MKTNLIDTFYGAMDKGLIKLGGIFRRHPVISYIIAVGPTCLLVALGYTSIREGMFTSEVDIAKRED